MLFALCEIRSVKCKTFGFFGSVAPFIECSERAFAHDLKVRNGTEYAYSDDDESDFSSEKRVNCDVKCGRIC